LDEFEVRLLNDISNQGKISERDRERLSSLLFPPSKTFAVSTARIGSGAIFERQFLHISEEITLEDLFTLFHQNIKACVAWQKSQLGLSLELLPQGLKSLTLECEKENIGALMGVNLLHPLIEITYNIPLRNHSGNLKILYDTEKKESSITLDFYGYNRINRMEVMAARAVLESILNDLSLEMVPTYDSNRSIFSVSWRVADEKKVPSLLKLIKNLSDITCFEGNEMRSVVNEEEYLNKGILDKIDEHNKELIKGIDVMINIPELRKRLNI